MPHPNDREPTVRRLGNGLVACVQPMPRTRAVAVEVVVPGGSVDDPDGRVGLTTLAWEWADRGAGGRTPRERQEAFAAAGIRHGGASGRDRSGLSASLLADELPRALSLLADELLRPHLDDREFDTARLHALEARDALEDRPAELSEEALSARAFVGRYGRSAYGDPRVLAEAVPDEVRAQHAATAGPAGTVVAIAGGVDAAQALDAVESAFGGWRGQGRPRRHGPRWSPPARHDLDLDARQVQLGWAWPLLPAHDGRAPAQALGLAVLAEGMGARLFREVRETRGLAYAVAASARAVPGAAWAVAYAGTTPGRAEETHAVVTEQLARLRDGVADDELERARTLLRTREATRGESSAGRAAALVQDLVLLGRARSAEQRLAALNRPDRAAVDAALAAAPATEPTSVVLGPAAVAGDVP